MQARIDRLREVLETSFWFVPILMLFASGVLALVLIAVDRRYDPGVKSSLSWAYSGGPEGARSLLSTIAGSMITAASVTFSLASVALSIASQQYGSRVLRNFMRDKITQILLGTFVATFLYSVLVVRSIRGTSNADGSLSSGGFVPSISVTGAIALSLASLVLLIYFIHHISASIQASRIVRVIADDMAEAIPHLYPSQTGEPLARPVPEPSSVLEQLHQRGFLSITAPHSGYLQSLDLDALLALATKEVVVLELAIKPGDHLLAGDELARVLGATELPARSMDRIRNAFLVGGERTPLQDIRYQFQQLTDVIIRALSPGINDPFTAVNGIDELAAGIALLGSRGPIVAQRQDAKGDLRLILATPSLGKVLDETVGHIVVYGAGDRFVMAALRRVLAIAQRYASSAADHEAVTDMQAELTIREQSATQS
jgi:uncharacterized membrane protein